MNIVFLSLESQGGADTGAVDGEGRRRKKKKKPLKKRSAQLAISALTGEGAQVSRFIFLHSKQKLTFHSLARKLGDCLAREVFFFFFFFFWCVYLQ